MLSLISGPSSRHENTVSFHRLELHLSKPNIQTVLFSLFYPIAESARPQEWRPGAQTLVQWASGTYVSSTVRMYAFLLCPPKPFSEASELKVARPMSS